MSTQPLPIHQVELALEQLQGWEIDEAGTRLLCELQFPDFRAAMAFLTRFAFECEEFGHHAEIFNVYHTIQLGLTTHDAGGRITEKDLALARRVCELIASG